MEQGIIKATTKTILTKHMKGLIKIADLTMGKGYYNPLDIIEYTSPGSNIYFSIIDNKITGFALSYFIRGDNQNIKFCCNDIKGSIGLVKTIAIDPNYQNKGIGTKLLDATLADFNKNGINTAISFLWKSTDGKINASKLLENRLFKLYKTILQYWYYESLKKGYECPTCGKPPCNCSALLYLKNINCDSIN